MPNVDINGTTVNFPDSLNGDDLNKAVSQAASQMGQSSQSQPESFLDKAKGLYDSYKASPLYQASPVGVLNKTNDLIHQGADWLGEKAATGLASHGANPYAAAAVGTGLQMAPDIASTVATMGAPKQIPQSLLADKTLPSILKSTKGIPPNATRMALEDPSVLNLPGDSQSIQGKSQDIINAIKEAQSKIGNQFGQAYAEQGMKSPVENIINGNTPTKSILSNRSYEVPGEDIQKTQNIPGRSYQVPDTKEVSNNVPGYSYKTAPTQLFHGINPAEPTGELPGNSVSVPGRSYTSLEDATRTVNEPGRSYSYSEQGPNKILGHRDVEKTILSPQPAKGFDQLRNDYQSAMSGDLFKQQGTAGGYSEMSDTDKLAKLTDLKRSLQDQAIYPPEGQQLSPSQGAQNGAIKKMAGDIDQLRGTVSGGDKLAVADDAWHEMSALKKQLMSAFKDPYTGQDYLNRILKGNTDWLTSGRMAGKVGAIQRIEQITGKNVLQPALKEMAAAYLKNPDTMGLPSMSLKSIISSLVPAKKLVQAGQALREAPSIPRTAATLTPLTKELARQYLDQANGDRTLARQLAQKAGYSW